MYTIIKSDYVSESLSNKVKSKYNGKFSGIIVVGTGKKIDEAKKKACEEKKNLVIVPTVLSTDAMYTRAYREGYEYIDLPKEIKVDVDIYSEEILDIGTANLNNLGWFEIISCEIAMRYNEKKIRDAGHWNEIYFLVKGMLNEVKSIRSKEDVLRLNSVLKTEVEIGMKYGFDFEESVEHKLALDLAEQFPGMMHGLYLAYAIKFYAKIMGIWGEIEKYYDELYINVKLPIDESWDRISKRYVKAEAKSV